jgi:hypothetical protein
MIEPYGEIVNNSSFKACVWFENVKSSNNQNREEQDLVKTNTQGAFKQLLLGYVTGATNNYDRGYDALSLNGNSFINFIA